MISNVMPSDTIDPDEILTLDELVVYHELKKFHADSISVPEDPFDKVEKLMAKVRNMRKPALYVIASKLFDPTIPKSGSINDFLAVISGEILSVYDRRFSDF